MTNMITTTNRSQLGRSSGARPEHNTLLGDATYATLLFGGLALAEKRFPALREPQCAPAR